MTPHEQRGDMLFTLVSLATIDFGWLEFLPPVNLQNGGVD